ncbi:probable BOI-related E3 ubiquitin-protein ligase 3 [Diospyros lotus]|uniref:probable BOI-related E3 ubiquitin-protein ligase 3 n=1 Tax=Diospyros lotus TaxID=55363 RepID=UPI0022537881|nr:probable BOI-related E3 ubiquitin-protein ligase 3 [Diospyros lotus]
MLFVRFSLFLSILFLRLCPQTQTSKGKEPSIRLERGKEWITFSMAVEARHLNLFPSQLIGNREMIMSGVDANVNDAYSNAAVAYGLAPVSGLTAEALPPLYGSSIVDCLPAKAAVKDDSGLTYAFPSSRKRSRDSIYPSIYDGQFENDITFLGENVSMQIRQQQLEIDHIIAQHTEKVRLEIEERRKGYTRRLVAAVEEGILKRLRAKEEEIEKIGKLNWALEQRVKALCVENQIWRDMAQTNEATANALRSNIEHLLSQAKDDHQPHPQGDALDEASVPAALADDAQSCCGSNDDRRTLASCAGESKCLKDKHNTIDHAAYICRQCGKEESSVLILPCRHLCVCTVCAASVHSCPICNSAKSHMLRVIV